MKKLIALLLTASALVWAQSKAPETPPAQLGDTVKVIEIKKGDVDRVAGTLRSVLGGLAAITTTGNRIVVRGNPDAVKVIEDAIVSLDIAPPPTPVTTRSDVELTMHVLYASAQTRPEDKVPSDLESTVRQLRGVFPYLSYRVIDTLVLRGAGSGRIRDNGSLPGTLGSYALDISTVIESGTPRTVRLSLNVNYTFTTGRASLITNIEAKEGQKTVLTKSNIAGTEDAILLVVTPRVIENR